MNEGELGFFVLLAKRGNFSETAREIGLTASAVSRRLARLEERLGVRLMNRTTRRVSLTGEGEAYYKQAIKILSQIEDLENSLQNTRKTPSGLLKINATFVFCRKYIAPIISKYKHKNPDVEVQLVLTDAPMNIIEEGFDINIRFGSPPSSNLVQKLLQRNRRFMCAAPSYIEKYGAPKNLNDLQKHNCIILRQEHDIYDIWRFDEQEDEAPSARISGGLSTNDGEVARNWLLEGHGIMLRSEWDIVQHVRDGNLSIISPDFYQTANIMAVYPERHQLTAKVRVFIDMLSESLKITNMNNPFQLTNNDF